MTASEPTPHDKDAPRQPEDLGPHLQSELNELLAGIDGEAEAQASAEEPGAPLPQAKTGAILNGLLDEAPAPTAPDQLAQDPDEVAADLAAPDANEAQSASELDDEAVVDADLNAFMAEADGDSPDIDDNQALPPINAVDEAMEVADADALDNDELADLIDDLETQSGAGEGALSDVENLGEELFEEAPQGNLDDALAAEDFDLDEDLFDFASLESGGGFAADDALDIEEFLEAVGEGDSFDSVDSDAVGTLAEGNNLLADIEASLPEGASAALAEIEAKLESAEAPFASVSQTAQEPQPFVVQEHLVSASSGKTWAWWLAGVAILIGTNLAVATFLSNDRDLARNNLEEARASLVEATAELAARRAADTAFIADLRTPLALPQTDPNGAFSQVRDALDVEDFSLARRRLYALLATVDRRESEDERTTIEAHAAFMLADIDRLEADAMGGRQ